MSLLTIIESLEDEAFENPGPLGAKHTRAGKAARALRELRILCNSADGLPVSKILACFKND